MGCIGSIHINRRPFRNISCLGDNDNADGKPCPHYEDPSLIATPSNDDGVIGTNGHHYDCIGEASVSSSATGNEYEALKKHDISIYMHPYSPNRSTDDVSSSMTEEFGRQFLQCPVCLKKYKNPKTLPCYHSLCKNCLPKRVSEGKIRCPVCHRENNIPRKGLPNCENLGDLLQLVGPKKVDDVVPNKEELCGKCTKRKGERYCLDCALLMCEDCRRSQHDLPATSSHTFKSSEEYHDQLRESQPVVCSRHDGNKVMHYCVTCDVPVCVECTSNDHLNHQFETLKESRRKMLAKLEKTLTTADKKLTSIDKTKTRLGDLEDQLAKRTRKEMEDLNRGLQEMGSRLQRVMRYFETQKAFLEDEHKFRFGSRRNELEAKLNNAEKTSQEVSKCIDDSTRLLEHSNEIGFLYIVNHITKRLEQASDTDSDKITTNVNFKYSAEEKLQIVEAIIIRILFDEEVCVE